MSTLYYRLARSNHPLVRRARRLYWAIHTLTLPAPRVVVRPMLWVYLAGRAIHRYARRTLVCEPLFKAYCKRYGSGVRTSTHIHFVQGKGDIVLGDNVEVDGKSCFLFAVRFWPHPTLTVGSDTRIGHNCTFTVGKAITIGHHCLIASDVIMSDSSGHPSDPAERLAGLPPSADDVRPVVIGNNVWIGRRCIITPGATIGDNSIVSAGSVVVGHVPPNTVVAGFPARKVAALRDPAAQEVAPEPCCA